MINQRSWCSSLFKFTFNRVTKKISIYRTYRFKLQGFWRTILPLGTLQIDTDVSTYQITIVKCYGWIRSMFWCLLNKAAWDCSASPCGLSSRLQGIWVTHCTSGFPPGGPGTGRGRLTNCKGFNWAAHKLFSLHKGIGSNKCHKPIMR